MEKYYIKNDNNRVENPFLTQGEGKKRGRRGEEEAKKRLRSEREVAWHDESRVKGGLKQGLRLQVLRVAIVLGMMMGWGVNEARGATVTYHIINLGQLDDYGQLTTTRTEALQFTTTSLIVGLPDAYKSPLAKNWQYYSSSDVTYNASTKVCVFNSEPSLSVGDEVSDGAHVYVTYELDEDRISDVGLYNGGVCRVKFPNGYYLKQSYWMNGNIKELNTTSSNTDPNTSPFWWKFNIIDPYQITVQSQSQSDDNCFDYYLCSKNGNFGDIRLKATISEARETKVWVFGLLNGGTDGTYRLVVTDGYTTNPSSSNQLDSYGHGYLNNKRDNYKTTYHLYNRDHYERCDLTFEPLTKTYIILNSSGETLVQATTTDYPLEVPDVIKSPFATYSYYSDAACTHEISAVGNTTTIYVRYTTTNGSLNLNGGTEYYVHTNNNYWYAVNATTIGIANSFADPTSETKWTLNGNDAYQLTIKNVGNNNEVTYDVSSGEAVPTLSGTGSKFFLHQSNTGQYEVVAVTSGDYTTGYYSMGVANNTLKLYSSSNYPFGQDEVQSVFLTQIACAKPVIAFDYTTGQVTISTATTGATIHYTTNGTEPTTSSQSYSNPFTINSTTTIKAIAVKTGFDNSEMAERTFEQVATPTIQDNGSNAISITCDTDGATIYYTTDGSGTPNIEYTGPLTEGFSGVTIRAIAIKENMVPSAERSGSVTLRCATPVITRVDMTFTLSCSMPTDASLYYRLGSGEETEYIEAVSFTPEQLPTTVTAVARHSNYTDSETATLELTSGTGSPTDPYLIYSVNDFSEFVANVNNGTTASACYKLMVDLSVSGTSAITTAFTGTFDGNFHTLTNLGHPIFNTINGGTVKNVMLSGVAISSDVDTVGAITNIAKGYSRIYNCGILPNDNTFPKGTHPTVTTTGKCAGGLVGSLRNDSRVVNCFSYADVSSTGYAAGIVGNNTFASNTAVTDGKYANLRTMVVNCMFYGDITAGSTVWPVYGGTKITNAGATAINNYNFYSDSCHFSAPLETSHNYYCSWPAKYDYLTRYEFHRYLLNSNRELCGWWVGAPEAPSTMTTANVQAVPKDATLMAKWVLDRNVAPFPILKPFDTYSSPINIDADASWRTSANKWEGKKLGTLRVTINPGGHAASGITSTTKNIVITDMDTIHGDYCYRKIQLPYYNEIFGAPNGTTWTEKYGGNYTDFVATGWEITSTNGAEGTFTANWQDGYNFADRYCSKKDIYNASTNPRIFAQGGYYYVPYDVTEITITAHWGKAVYLGNGDNNYDRVDFNHLLDNEANSNRPGTAFEPAGTRPATLGNGQTILTGKIATVADSLPNSGTVFDNALVLVGNHQFCTGGENVAPSRSFTIMSADFDLDNEPDYCLEWQLGVGTTRQSICPIRFDFLPVIEIGLGLKKDGSTQYYSLGCYRPLGHYEVTETALIRFGQFEFSNKDRTVYAPLILNGGIYEQYVKGTKGNAFSSADDKIDYIIIGGNVYMPNFSPGAHVNSNASFPTRHCAVNAIGGKFDNLFLTGNFNDAVTPNADNPHCYIDGGWFGQVAAAGKEGINGNVFFELNHAVVHEFYGGGTIADKRVTGNIEVTVDSSRVYKYCGGPKFGDMYEDKTVTTHATGTTFGVFYGGGNGGTSYVQFDRTDGEQSVTYNFNLNVNSGGHHYYYPGEYRDLETGYQANYDMTITNVSTGTNPNKAIYRSYFFAAQFSATNTGDISNTLTGCKVLKNYYGGGNLGGVDGNVTSILDNTEVQGSAFGAGFSASIPTVTIYNKDKTPPSIDVYTGNITPQSGGTSTTYTWTNETSLGGTSLSTSSPAVLNPNGDEINYFFTEKPLQNLGTVSGRVSLTITGNSVIGTSGVSTTGNVYGGGDQSAVTGNTTVKLQGNARVLGNVYGGGNEGPVGGNSEVIIQDP